jgi:hypothetical protein
MRDFCGKNGCYQVDIEDNVEYVNVFLNSVKVLEGDSDQFMQVGADEREVPDVVFELVKEEDTDCMLTTGMEVPAFCADGVNEFLASLIQDSDKITDREGLYKEVQQLLNQDGAPWGSHNG